jgi:hypothetical protein
MQNNRTLMIASVAQNQQSRGRQGLPILGLVPVLGNLFSAPRREDSQTDIVIAVTPHVMRASTVTPEDEEMRPSGTLQTPTAGTLEAMLNEVAREEQLAAARSIPRHASVELPPAEAEPRPVSREPRGDEATTFVPAPKELMNGVVERPAAAPAPPAAREALIDEDAAAPPSREPSKGAEPARPQGAKLSPGNSLFSFEKPAPARVAARDVSYTAPAAAVPVSVITEKALTDREAATATSAASLRLMSEPRALRVGERRQLKVLIKTDAPLGLIALTFRLDPRVLAVRSVAAGSLSSPADARVTHAVTPEGLLLVTVAPARPASPLSGAGVLLVFDVEALSAGAEALRFDADDVHLVATDGRKVLVKVMTDQLSVSE